MSPTISCDDEKGITPLREINPYVGL